MTSMRMEASSLVFRITGWHADSYAEFFNMCEDDTGILGLI